VGDNIDNRESSHSERLTYATCRTARENPDPAKQEIVLHVRALETNATNILALVARGVYFSGKQSRVSMFRQFGDGIISVDDQSYENKALKVDE
jgi:hypothetical protein